MRGEGKGSGGCRLGGRADPPRRRLYGGLGGRDSGGTRSIVRGTRPVDVAYECGVGRVSVGVDRRTLCAAGVYLFTSQWSPGPLR